MVWNILWGALAWVAGAQILLPGGVPSEPVANAPMGAVQSRLIIYSTQDADDFGVQAVQLQGVHYALLVRRAYQDSCFVAGPMQVALRTAWPEAAGDTGAATELELRAGQTHYVRLSRQGTGVALSEVPQMQARQELQGVRRQWRSWSEVNMPCEADPWPLQMRALARLPLPADGAWTGDGMRLNAAGEQALQTLLARWREDFVQLDRVRVVAHIPGAFNDEHQAQVALQRARHVTRFLRKAGAGARRFESEALALGMSSLADCSAARAEQPCPLGPNWVVLEALGLRR